MRLFLLSFLFLLSPLELWQTPAYAATESKEIKIATFDFCPWQCPNLKDSKNPGISIEVAKLIFEASGYKVRLINVPYARSIKGTEDGDYDVILNVNALTSKKLLLSKESSAYIEMNFYLRKEDNWHYTGVASLKNIEVISIIGYNYSPLSPAYQKYLSENKGKKVIYVSGDSAPERAFRMILSKRATTFNEAASVFEYVTFKEGTRDLFKKGETLGGGPLYAGFPLNRDDAKIHQALFDKGIVQLRKDGTLGKILARYGVSDWKGNLKTIKSRWDND